DLTLVILGDVGEAVGAIIILVGSVSNFIDFGGGGVIRVGRSRDCCAAMSAGTARDHSQRRIVVIGQNVEIGSRVFVRGNAVGNWQWLWDSNRAEHLDRVDSFVGPRMVQVDRDPGALDLVAGQSKTGHEVDWSAGAAAIGVFPDGVEGVAFVNGLN